MSCNVHSALMTGTRTISLKIEAYERLRTARRYPTESFSEVVLRASWPEDTVTARELLAAPGRPRLSERELDELAEMKRLETGHEDKWAAH